MNELMHRFTCGATIRIKGYENDCTDSARGVTIYIEDSNGETLLGRYDCIDCGCENSGELYETRITVAKKNIAKLIEILQRYMEMEGEPMKVRKIELSDDDNFELVHKNKTITFRRGEVRIYSSVGNLKLNIDRMDVQYVRSIVIKEGK